MFDGGLPLPQLAQWFLLAAAFLVAVFVIWWALSRIVGGRISLPGGERGRSRQPRLGIVDIYDLDRQRQLVLLRRDNVEHLLLIGGPNDVVVESNIARLPSRAAHTPPEAVEPPEAAAPVAPPRPAIEPVRPVVETIPPPLRTPEPVRDAVPAVSPGVALPVEAAAAEADEAVTESSDEEDDLAPEATVAPASPRIDPAPGPQPENTVGRSGPTGPLKTDREPDAPRPQPTFPPNLPAAAPAPARSEAASIVSPAGAAPPAARAAEPVGKDLEPSPPRQNGSIPAAPARPIPFGSVLGAPPAGPPTPPPPATPPAPPAPATPPAPAAAPAVPSPAPSGPAAGSAAEQPAQRPASETVVARPANQPAAPAASAPAPGRVPDTAILSDMTKRLEEALRRPSTGDRSERPQEPAAVSATPPVRPAPAREAEEAVPASADAGEPRAPEPTDGNESVKAKSSDPFSVEEIEAEFARLLGRTPDKA